jgi:hypothetical protein
MAARLDAIWESAGAGSRMKRSGGDIYKFKGMSEYLKGRN